MDKTAGVKRNILDFLRDNHLGVGDLLHDSPRQNILGHPHFW
jgi:hypothetical protein